MRLCGVYIYVHGCLLHTHQAPMIDSGRSPRNLRASGVDRAARLAGRGHWPMWEGAAFRGCRFIVEGWHQFRMAWGGVVEARPGRY